MVSTQAHTTQITPQTLKDASDRAYEMLMEFAGDRYGIAGALNARENLGLNELSDEEFSKHPLNQLCVMWFLFQWTPETSTAPLDVFPLKDTIVAEFLADHSLDADPVCRRYLRAAQHAPLCYWQIIAVEPGKGSLLKNLFSEEECFVEDKSSSHIFEKWDIVFAQVVDVDDCHIFNVIAPYALSPSRFRQSVEAAIERTRRHAKTFVDLLGYDLDLIHHYQECMEKLLNPIMPELQNTDGDKLKLFVTKYTFRPENREKISEAILGLRNIESENDETDKSSFIWAVRKTVKARIEVLESSIQIETNSFRRDKAIRKRLERALKGMIVHEETQERGFDEDIGCHSALEPADGALNLHTLPPEARQEIESAMEHQFMKWADEEVPMLDDRTPREVAKTAEGRKQVAAMINDWEHMMSRNPNPQFQFDFDKLRAELGVG